MPVLPVYLSDVDVPGSGVDADTVENGSNAYDFYMTTATASYLLPASGTVAIPQSTALLKVQFEPKAGSHLLRWTDCGGDIVTQLNNYLADTKNQVTLSLNTDGTTCTLTKVS